MKRFDLKKLLLVLLVVCMAFTLFACKDKPEPDDDTGKTPPTPPAPQTTSFQVLVGGVEALQNTIDAAATAVADGKLGATLGLEVMVKAGDKVDETIGLNAVVNLDLIGTAADATNKGLITLTRGGEAITTAYLDNTVLYLNIPAGDIAAAIQIGNEDMPLNKILRNNVMKLAADDNTMFDYNGLGMDLAGTVGGLEGMLGNLLSSEIAADGTIALSDEAMDLVVSLLPTLTSSLGVDLDALVKDLEIPGVPEDEDPTLADVIGYVKVGLSLKFETAGDLLTGISLNVNIAKSETAPADLDIPTIAFGLKLNVVLDDATVVSAPADFSADDYTTVSAVNVNLDADVEVLTDDESAGDKYNVKALIDLDPMALIMQESIGVRTATMANLGKASIVVKKDIAGDDDPVVLEAFYDSSVDEANAYAYMNFTMADGTNYTYKCVVDLVKLAQQDWYTTKMNADVFTVVSDGGASEAGFSLTDLDFGGIIAALKEVIGSFAVTAKTEEAPMSISIDDKIITAVCGIVEMFTPVDAKAVDDVYRNIFGAHADGLKISVNDIGYGKWSIVADGDTPAYAGFAINQAGATLVKEVELASADILELAIGSNLPEKLSFKVTYVDGEGVETEETVDLTYSVESSYNNLATGSLNEEEEWTNVQKVAVNAKIDGYLTVFPNILSVVFTEAEESVITANIAEDCTDIVLHGEVFYVLSGANVMDMGLTLDMGENRILLNKGSITTTMVNQNTTKSVGLINDNGIFVTGKTGAEVHGFYTMTVSAGGVSEDFDICVIDLRQTTPDGNYNATNDASFVVTARYFASKDATSTVTTYAIPNASFTVPAATAAKIYDTTAMSCEDANLKFKFDTTSNILKIDRASITGKYAVLCDFEINGVNIGTELTINVTATAPAAKA